MTLATRMAVRDGRLVQFDEPKTIYREPLRRRAGDEYIWGMVDGGVFKQMAVLAAPDIADRPVVLGIRSEQVEMTDAPMIASSMVVCEFH